MLYFTVKSWFVIYEKLSLSSTLYTKCGVLFVLLLITKILLLSHTQHNKQPYNRICSTTVQILTVFFESVWYDKKNLFDMTRFLNHIAAQRTAIIIQWHDDQSVALLSDNEWCVCVYLSRPTNLSPFDFEI